MKKFSNPSLWLWANVQSSQYVLRCIGHSDMFKADTHVAPSRLKGKQDHEGFTSQPKNPTRLNKVCPETVLERPHFLGSESVSAHFPHTHQTHGTHTITLKCSLKPEQRCVTRCVRPTSTGRMYAGERRAAQIHSSPSPQTLPRLLSAIWQSGNLYDPPVLWGSPYYPPLPAPPSHRLLPKHTGGLTESRCVLAGREASQWRLENHQAHSLGLRHLKLKSTFRGFCVVTDTIDDNIMILDKTLPTQGPHPVEL